jgi:hypothetical protein
VLTVPGGAFAAAAPHAVSRMCPRRTRCSYTKSSPAMEETQCFNASRYARKQQDSLVMRRSGGRSEACLSICWGSSRPHQDAPGQIPRLEISRHPSRVREEAVVIRTESNADSNPSRHGRHDLDHLARLHARAGRWWMRSDYLRGPTDQRKDRGTGSQSGSQLANGQVSSHESRGVTPIERAWRCTHIAAHVDEQEDTFGVMPTWRTRPYPEGRDLPGG